MRQPGNMWVEAWESATPLPVYRQKRLFDDTKEAEKVLHYLSGLKTSELALMLLPMVLHSAILAVEEKLGNIDNQRVTYMYINWSSLIIVIRDNAIGWL